MSLAQGEAVMCKVLHPDHVVTEQFFHPSMSFGLQLPLYRRNRSGGREEAECKKEEPKLSDMFDADKTDGIKTKKIPSFTKMSFFISSPALC